MKTAITRLKTIKSRQVTLGIVVFWAALMAGMSIWGLATSADKPVTFGLFGLIIAIIIILADRITRLEKLVKTNKKEVY